MIFATLASLFVGGLIIWWMCRKVDESEPKDPSEWRK